MSQSGPEFSPPKTSQTLLGIVEIPHGPLLKCLVLLKRPSGSGEPPPLCSATDFKARTEVCIQRVGGQRPLQARLGSLTAAGPRLMAL